MSKISPVRETTPFPLSEEELRLRRRRSNALGIALGALSLLFFLVTIFKMGAQILQRPM